MAQICKVVFNADTNRPYDYLCGDLRPLPGDLIVVPVGKDNSNKIVTCVRGAEDEQPRFALKTIVGIVIRQDQAARLGVSLGMPTT